MMNFNFWKYFAITITILFLISIWYNNNQTDRLHESISIINNYQTDSMRFTSEINKLRQEVNIQESAIVTKNIELEKSLLKNSKLKELNYQIKIDAKTEIKNLIAKYSNSYNMVFPNITDGVIDTSQFINFIDSNYIRVGTEFSLEDKWYSLNGTIEHSSLNIKSIIIRNNDEYNLGYKKKSLKNIFKKDILVLEVIHLNPHTNTTTLKNIKLVPQKKWYQKTSFKLAAGFIIGSVTVKYLTKD